MEWSGVGGSGPVCLGARPLDTRPTSELSVRSAACGAAHSLSHQRSIQTSLNELKPCE